MKIVFKGTVLLMTILVVMAGCQGRNKKVEGLAPGVHQVKVVQALQTPDYTYLRVLEDEKDYWIAITGQEVKEGETYFWGNGMEMQNFTSKQLKRTFPSIMFVSMFSDKPILATKEAKMRQSMAGKQQAPEVPDIKVTPATGGITIAELFSNQDKYNGKTVKIRGQVVRFSAAIMNRNWVHLQDGTVSGNYYDLAVTTNDTVRVGDVVTFQGQIALKKDFGAGYVYDVIMELATPVK
jgi:hypothetical protein